MDWVQLLLISGICSLPSCVPYQYHFVDISKTWTEAQSYCREIYTDLVTIESQEEVQTLFNIVTLSGFSGGVWIGLENPEEWWWSLAETRFYTNGETEYRNWDSGQPDNYLGNQNCVVMTGDGRWDDFACSNTLPFVCFNESSRPDQQYILINNIMTWKAAQSYCREKYTDLVSVRNQAENNLIRNMFISGSRVWLGLYRKGWQWSDQSNSSFRDWSLNTPKNLYGHENCAVAWMVANGQGRWGDVQCDKIYPFICYGAAQFTPVEPLQPQDLAKWEMNSINELILVEQNKTWNEALSYCRQNYTDLVSVHNEQMQQWVERLVKNACTAHVWLGLRYSCVQNFWFFAGEGLACYYNWAPGNGTGTGHCGNTGAVESAGGQWVSLHKTERLNFICYK